MGRRTDSQRDKYLRDYARTCMQREKINASPFASREKLLKKAETPQSIRAKLEDERGPVRNVISILLTELSNESEAVHGQLIAGARFTGENLEAATTFIRKLQLAEGGNGIRGTTVLYFLASKALLDAIALNLYDDLVEMRG